MLRPPSLSELRENIVGREIVLGKRTEAVLRFMIENPGIAAFCTCQSIAKSFGTSHATVNRLAGNLGFNRFAELRELFRQSLRGERQGKSNSLYRCWRKSAPVTFGATSGSALSDRGFTVRGADTHSAMLPRLQTRAALTANARLGVVKHQTIRNLLNQHLSQLSSSKIEIGDVFR